MYINKIARCLGIVYILNIRRQDHQWKNLMKCSTIFTSWLYTNHIYIQQASDIQTKFQSILQSPQNIYSSLCLPPLIHDKYPPRSLLSLLNPPPVLIHLRLFWLNMELKPHPKKCLPVLMINFTSKMKNFSVLIKKLTSNKKKLTGNMKNWFISQRCHFNSKRTPRRSNKTMPSFYQK